MRQGRGVLGSVSIRVAAAAAADTTMLYRAASYMYTYLSPIWKKSDPRFIMPIIFFWVIGFGAFQAFEYELDKNTLHDT